MNFVIKVCGVTNTEDAVCAVEAGANAIGLNFYASSPRGISISAAHDIASALPDDVLKVGVFVEPSIEEVQAAIDEVPLDVVQLHGKSVPPIVFRTWRALAATQVNPMESIAAEAILLDSHSPGHGGSGKTFDWNLATRFWQPVILAGGLDASNVAQAIELVRPAGVDACSRLESRPGIKDWKKVQEFVKVALAAAASLEKVPT
jgi:phosphoribosylanthranilate isomerase